MKNKIKKIGIIFAIVVAFLFCIIILLGVAHIGISKDLNYCATAYNELSWQYFHNSSINCIQLINGTVHTYPIFNNGLTCEDYGLESLESFWSHLKPYEEGIFWHNYTDNNWGNYTDTNYSRPNSSYIRYKSNFLYESSLEQL